MPIGSFSADDDGAGGADGGGFGNTAFGQCVDIVIVRISQAVVSHLKNGGADGDTAAAADTKVFINMGVHLQASFAP